MLKSRSRKFTQAGAPNDAAVRILASSTCKFTQTGAPTDAAVQFSRGAVANSYRQAL